MSLPVIRSRSKDHDPLKIDARLVATWLVAFLRDEVKRKRGISKAVLGLSGGVDSAVVAYLCARAFGPENVLAVRMPYKLSSPSSLTDAQTIVDDTGIKSKTIDISNMVDGYTAELSEPPSPPRLGNICARCRMILLFDQGAAVGALPIGTGNKSERLFGYFTWHADDSPPINPLGDLLISQVWQLARELGVPSQIIDKPASADLEEGQTDEGDFGISYGKADAILHHLISGFSKEQTLAGGFTPDEVETVAKRLGSTHWKRRMPTVAMLSNSAIGEYYLRPVDY